MNAFRILLNIMYITLLYVKVENFSDTLIPATYVVMRVSVANISVINISRLDVCLINGKSLLQVNNLT